MKMEVNCALPFGEMVVIILIHAINMVVSKNAMSHGLNKYIYIAYCNAVSAVILFPCSFIFHRSSERLPLNFDVLLGFFLMAIFGTAEQMFGYAGIQYSSPNLASALLNLIPAFTFILAIIFGMEKVEWRSGVSQVKLVGTIVSIGGAFVVTFYKGPPILTDTKPSSLTNTFLFLPLHSAQSNWILGGFLVAAQAFSISASYIVQVLVVKKYPTVFVIQFYQNLFSAIFSAICALIVVRDASAWRLRPDLSLVAVLYSSVVGNAIRLPMLTWCLLKTGPIFVAAFKPLVIFFAVLMSVMFLGDALHLGSLIGTVTIVIGFYSVMWGKAKEKEIYMDNNGVGSSSNSNTTPLLINKTEHV